MMRPARRAALAHTLALAAGVLAAGCASEAVAPGHPKTVLDAPLGPYDSIEECLRLVAGDRLDFEYHATQPVSFDIRYHEGNAVVAPVVREQVADDSGVFMATLTEDYCLVWQAGPAGAEIDYRLGLRPAPR